MSASRRNTIARNESAAGYIVERKRWWADKKSVSYRIGLRKGEQPGYAVAGLMGDLATQCWIEINPHGICIQGPGYSRGGTFRSTDEARLTLLRDEVAIAVQHGRKIYHDSWTARTYEALSEQAAHTQPTVLLHVYAHETPGEPVPDCASLRESRKYQAAK